MTRGEPLGRSILSLPPAARFDLGLRIFEVAATSVLLAPLGARTAQRIKVVALKRLFSVLLLALAASMLHRGLTG